MENNPGMFSSNLNFFLTEDRENMDDMGVSRLSGNFYLKVNYSFKQLNCSTFIMRNVSSVY